MNESSGRVLLPQHRNRKSRSQFYFRSILQRDAARVAGSLASVRVPSSAYFFLRRNVLKLIITIFLMLYWFPLYCLQHSYKNRWKSRSGISSLLFTHQGAMKVCWWWFFFCVAWIYFRGRFVLITVQWSLNEKNVSLLINYSVFNC